MWDFHAPPLLYPPLLYLPPLGGKIYMATKPPKKILACFPKGNFWTLALGLLHWEVFIVKTSLIAIYISKLQTSVKNFLEFFFGLWSRFGCLVTFQRSAVKCDSTFTCSLTWVAPRPYETCLRSRVGVSLFFFATKKQLVFLPSIFQTRCFFG